MNSSQFKKLHFCMLGSGTQLTGDLKINGDAVINGHIEGSLTMDPDSNLIIEKDAQIHGDINAHDLEVSGKVTGTIKSTGLVKVKSSAVLSGKIAAAKIHIAPGAICNIEGNTTD